jgi:hypothetical protein
MYLCTQMGGIEDIVSAEPMAPSDCVGPRPWMQEISHRPVVPIASDAKRGVHNCRSMRLLGGLLSMTALPERHLEVFKIFRAKCNRLLAKPSTISLPANLAKLGIAPTC